MATATFIIAEIERRAEADVRTRRKRVCEWKSREKDRSGRLTYSSRTQHAELGPPMVEMLGCHFGRGV